MQAGDRNKKNSKLLLVLMKNEKQKQTIYGFNVYIFGF